MKGINTAEAAAIIGKSPQFVRVAMQKGVLDIGECMKMSNKSSTYSYAISPAKLAERQGISVEKLYEMVEGLRA